MNTYEYHEGRTVMDALSWIFSKMKSTGEDACCLSFNDLEVTVRIDSHPADIYRIWNLLSELRYIKAHNTITNKYQ